MKWRAVVADDKSGHWQEAKVGFGVPKYELTFVIEELRHHWVAYCMIGDNDYAVGEYASERVAKAACRRKAGAMIRRMIRDMQA